MSDDQILEYSKQESIEFAKFVISYYIPRNDGSFLDKVSFGEPKRKSIDQVYDHFRKIKNKV